MIRRIAALAALSLSAVPVARAEPVRAQVTPVTTGPSRSVSVGFGVGIEPLSTISLGSAANGAAPVAIYVPIQIGPALRIEPSLGFWHQGGNSNFISPSSQNAWSLGVGGLLYLSPPTPTGFYVGGRLNLLHTSATRGNGGGKTDVSATDFSLAPVFGGEYAFASRFSVGAEVQMPITFYGNQSSTTGGITTTPNADETGISTNAVIFFRYFFL